MWLEIKIKAERQREIFHCCPAFSHRFTGDKSGSFHKRARRLSAYRDA